VKKTNGRENCNVNSNVNEKGNNDENRNTNQKVPKIYNDPSLFRTANIQPITPACIQITNDSLKKTINKEAIKQEFPNEDIEKDFERSLRVNENKENNNNRVNNNNQILDFIQIKKDNRTYDNQSKDMLLTNNNNTARNHKISCRWQFAADNFDHQSNDSAKSFKNNEFNCHNVDNMHMDNDCSVINNGNSKNKKLSNENVTWNRNMFNNRNGNKENSIMMLNGNDEHIKTGNSIPIHSNHRNDNLNCHSKQNHITKSSLFQNNYSQYFPPSVSSTKIFKSNESASNNSCNNNNHSTNLSAVTAVMNELSQITLIPSNPIMSSFSGINQMTDSISTMMSYRS